MLDLGREFISGSSRISKNHTTQIPLEFHPGCSWNESIRNVIGNSLDEYNGMLFSAIADRDLFNLILPKQLSEGTNLPQLIFEGHVWTNIRNSSAEPSTYTYCDSKKQTISEWHEGLCDFRGAPRMITMECYSLPQLIEIHLSYSSNNIYHN